ncbi:alanine and glycine-rich protein-like [Selaginella moellendorffii]|uniref:alanine and glycine-rich protein-like n=1 Tax=Selaginella moellendorffii TaxID=88036 RepID=UPI000D1CE569|nr:alanine and glycine-rich protein-like [Selaginella moellendorffii]|eukprot:XP_024517966.1 alanine and glycine-rich protein-like [Selaginella moellendorffii]
MAAVLMSVGATSGSAEKGYSIRVYGDFREEGRGEEGIALARGEATCEAQQQTIQNQSAVVSKTAPMQCKRLFFVFFVSNGREGLLIDGFVSRSPAKEAFVPKLDDGGGGGPGGGDDGGGDGGGGGGGWGAGGWCFWGVLLLLGFLKSNEENSKKRRRRRQL